MKDKINIHEEIKKMCPPNSSVYFSQSQHQVSIILESAIEKSELSFLQGKILSFLGGRMLHDTYNTVKVLW